MSPGSRRCILLSRVSSLISDTCTSRCEGPTFCQKHWLSCKWPCRPGSCTDRCNWRIHKNGFEGCSVQAAVCRSTGMPGGARQLQWCRWCPTSLSRRSCVLTSPVKGYKSLFFESFKWYWKNLENFNLKKVLSFFHLKCNILLCTGLAIVSSRTRRSKAWSRAPFDTHIGRY